MITDFEWWHVDLIDVQEQQKEYVKSESYIGVQGPSFTYLEDYKPRACFGMQVQWEGRALVWAIVGDVHHWPSFHKSVKSRLDFFTKDMCIRRCEMITQVGFKQAERWAALLGFKKEATLSKYFSYGADATMWVKL